MKFFISLIFSLFFLNVEAQSVEDGQSETVCEYVANYGKYAAVFKERFPDVPFSFALAEGIIRSRWGTSIIAKECNNHFQIRCNDNFEGGYGFGQYYYFTYPHPIASYFNFAIIVMNDNEVRPALESCVHTCIGDIERVATAYANVNRLGDSYAKLIMKLVIDYQLHLYDDPNFTSQLK